MSAAISNERLMRTARASPEQLTAIDRVLDGTLEPVRPERRGPLLMRVCDAAQLLSSSSNHPPIDASRQAETGIAAKF